MGGEGGPLVVEGDGGDDGLVCEAGSAAVPVGGVEVVAFFAVEIGVDAGGVGGLELVDEGVGGGPISVGVEPEGVEEGWEGGGLRGGQRAEFGGGHAVIMRAAVEARRGNSGGGLFALPHCPAVERLQGPDVVWIQPGEGGDLLG